MSQIHTAEPAELDVRPIPKPQRHPLIFNKLDALDVGESLVVKNDHNPIPLRGQVEALYGSQFEWSYLEEGPQVFRLQFSRRESAPAGWQRTPAESRHSELPMVNQVAKPTVSVDLLKQCGAGARPGPQWSHESDDLDVTLLSWEKGKRIEAHVNSEVDAVCLGVEGSGIVTVDGVAHEVGPGTLLLIPKGCERAIESTSARFSYLSMHRRRKGLTPGFGSTFKPLAHETP